MEEILRNWVRAHLADITGQPAETIQIGATLADYGLDSVDAVLMAGALEERFGLEIDPASFLHFSTFEEMAVALAPRLATPENAAE